MCDDDDKYGWDKTNLALDTAQRGHPFYQGGSWCRGMSLCQDDIQDIWHPDICLWWQEGHWLWVKRTNLQMIWYQLLLIINTIELEMEKEKEFLDTQNQKYIILCIAVGL